MTKSWFSNRSTLAQGTGKRVTSQDRCQMTFWLLLQSCQLSFNKFYINEQNTEWQTLEDTSLIKIFRFLQIEPENVPALLFLWLLLHIEVICLSRTKKSKRQNLNKVSTTKLNFIARHFSWKNRRNVIGFLLFFIIQQWPI